MHKGIVCLVIFCMGTLALFVVLIILLSNVNPPQIHPLPPPPDETKDAVKLSEKLPEKLPEKPPEKPPETADVNTDTVAPGNEDRRRKHERRLAMKNFSYKEGQPLKIISNELETGLTVDNTTESNSTDTKRRFLPSDDNATEGKNNSEGLSESSEWLTSTISDVSKASEPVYSVKGYRRSIENKENEDLDSNDPHSIRLKIIDDQGKQRLEIVIRNSGSFAMTSGTNNRLPRGKTMLTFYKSVRGRDDNNTVIYEADESKPTVIRVLSNNSLVVNDPKDQSNYPPDRNYSSAIDFMEEKFVTKKINNSRKFIWKITNSSNYNMVDNSKNIKTSAMFLDNPYTIKVRFDNKTEILRNESIYS